MSADKVKPLGNRVLIKRKEAQATRGGILLPDSAQEKPKQGTVVAVGPGNYDDQGKLQPMNLKVGDDVLFSSYAGTEVETENDTEYLIMTEDDVLGVLVTN
jgi:chaperonin GroES